MHSTSRKPQSWHSHCFAGVSSSPQTSVGHRSPFLNDDALPPGSSVHPSWHMGELPPRAELFQEVFKALEGGSELGGVGHVPRRAQFPQEVSKAAEGDLQPVHVPSDLAELSFEVLQGLRHRWNPEEPQEIITQESDFHRKSSKQLFLPEKAPSPRVIGQHHVVLVQQQIFDLRHDGRSPVFQNLCEVGGVAGVDSVRWRPEKEIKVSTRVSNWVKCTNPRPSSCSPPPPTPTSDPRAAQQLTERTKRNPESFIVTGRTSTNCCKGRVRAARWGASAAAACSETKRRPGRASSPV